MNVFKKYEFESQEQYNELKEQLQGDTSMFIDLNIIKK
jgi:hypothetical protein